MCAITNSKWIDGFKGINVSDCPTISENDEDYLWRRTETGFYKFEPYDNEFCKLLKVDELIEDLKKLIDDIREWRRDAL